MAGRPFFSEATDQQAAPILSTRAFSSEVDTGSREENASKQEREPPFRFNPNGKGSNGRRARAARRIDQNL
jgi:hypothetical protein